MQGTHEYKDNDFCTISFEEIRRGWIDKQAYDFLWKKEHEQDVEVDNQSSGDIKNVIIALKTVVTEFEDGEKTENNIEEMTSIFFLPVIINRDGLMLCPDEGRMPWVPREYLKPMEDPQIAVGDSDKYDEYLKITTDKRNQIDSWDKYLEYAVNMYEYITDAKFKNQYISYEDKEIKLDGKYYLFLDTTVNASFHIMQLYNELLDNVENKLYTKLTSGEIEPARELIVNTRIDKMIKHVGQMGGEFSLSPSQREVINHFDEIEEGDILAVSGPPGTGKTTLLQSVVANMYVQAALEKAEAPIIVAASTNNQAVTNIIDSFGKIDVIGISNLEKKWITGTNSFATFFPSKRKKKEAEKNRYQYTTVNGEAFFKELESDRNREFAKESFQKEYRKYLGKDETDFSTCANVIWKRLNELNEQRVQCLSKIQEIKGILGEDSYETYVNRLQTYKYEKENQKKEIQKEIGYIKNQNQKYLDRCSEWRNSYKKISWYVRLFKFLPNFRNKIYVWSFSFIEDEELGFLRRDMKIQEIENIYHRMIAENDNEIVKLTNRRNIIEKEISQLNHKCSTSRRNKEEAMQIVTWLKYHYITIVERYSRKSSNDINRKELVGVITPFKSQSILIKTMIRKEIPDYAQFIDVGTVHTFQGAERKVIIFSSVYGNEDGCFFINKQENLMNVAVSRAKDSFLVFGDSGCLSGNEKTAAGLLKSMTRAVVE